MTTTPSTTSTCAGRCGRPLRKRGQSAKAHPGTVVDHAHGQCRKCWTEGGRDKLYAGKVALDWTAERAPQCRKCRCPMRRYGELAEDHPGTLVHRGDGLCVTCHRWAHDPRPLESLEPRMRRRQHKPADCENCRRPMRTGKAPKIDAPDTIRYGGLGLCITCYEAKRAGKSLPKPGQVPAPSLKPRAQRKLEARIVEADQALGGFMAQRRAREAAKLERARRAEALARIPHRATVHPIRPTLTPSRSMSA